jgi:hypothetical protein
VLWVSAYTCQPTATAAIWKDIVEQMRANQKRAYCGSRNTDPVSIGGSGIALLIHVHL